MSLHFVFFCEKMIFSWWLKVPLSAGLRVLSGMGTRFVRACTQQPLLAGRLGGATNKVTCDVLRKGSTNSLFWHLANVPPGFSCMLYSSPMVIADREVLIVLLKESVDKEGMVVVQFSGWLWDRTDSRPPICSCPSGRLQRKQNPLSPTSQILVKKRVQLGPLPQG